MTAIAPTIRADRDQVCAFRLANHHVSRRLPAGGLLEATAACGIQNSPPGSAALALGARVSRFGLADLALALETEKAIVQVRSLRGAPHLVPTRDVSVFTSGLLPADEEELRCFIRGANEALDKVGISALALVDLTASALLAALDGHVMSFRALSRDLSERVAAELAPGQLAAWWAPGWYAPGQSLGEALIHFALYPLALCGLYCYAPRQGDEAAFVRLDQWLGGPLPSIAYDQAQTELVRRYLRCYGPSTAAHFGEWAGVAPTLAKRAWARTEPELVQVDFDGRRTWLLAADLPQLEDPPIAEGVRLLPPHDPYLAVRDRATLLPETRLRSQIWRSVGNPGVVLTGSRMVGVWRPEKRGNRLHVSVEPFVALDGRLRSEIADEAVRMAAWRGAAAGDVVFAE